MPDNEEVFSREEDFPKLFNEFFAGQQAFVKINDSNYKCEFMEYNGANAKFKIPDLKDIPSVCIIYARFQVDFVIYSNVKFSSKLHNHVFEFIPTSIKKVYSPRKETRIKLDQVQIPQLFITNIMSQFVLSNDLEMRKKKVDRVEDIIKVKLGKTFNNIKVYYIDSGRDERMKYFNDSIRPIFITNINEEPSDKEKTVYDYYMNNIYPQDNFLQNSKEFVSEISVPIVYRMKIPYGYVQVNNRNSVNEALLSLVKKMAVIIEELLNKHGVFSKTVDKLLVSNISKQGIGIVFNERKYFRYFKEGELLFFDLLLPEKKRANILAVVRHISSMGTKLYKIGCEIKDIDALSEVYYDELLESLGLPVN